MQTYGQEPWEHREVVSVMDRGRTKSLLIFDADGNIVCTIRTIKAKDQFSITDISNAIRIVASVSKKDWHDEDAPLGNGTGSCPQSNACTVTATAELLRHSLQRNCNGEIMTTKHDAVPVSAEELRRLIDRSTKLSVALNNLVDAYDGLRTDYTNALGISPQISPTLEHARTVLSDLSPFAHNTDVIPASREVLDELRLMLSVMMDWAREVSDQYLDGDPEVREQYVADLERARAILNKMKP